MKFNYELKIGDKTFFIEDEVATMQEFVKQVAPWQALEIETQGKTGVYLSFRKTKDDDEYYALLHPETGTELHLGIRKDGSGMLFPGKFDKNSKRTDKQWKSVQHGADSEEMAPPSKTATDQLPSTNHQPSEPKAEQEERLTVQVRELLDAAGIDNLGREKHKILNSLGLKVGLLLKDLSYHQKLDLYQVLFEEAKAMSGKRTAA